MQARALQRVRKLDRIFAFDANRDAAANFAEEIGGADSEEKQELAPELMASSKVITDVTDQCATIGDLHHAIAAGAMRRQDVYADLSEVVAGRKGGQESGSEVIIFDSAGMALQDVAAAAIVYERALASGRGTAFDFAAF